MNDLKKYFVILGMALLTSSCQIGYLMKTSYNQMHLLSQRVSLEKVLADPSVAENVKAKLRLAQEARFFAEEVLKLTPTKNYTSYVQLDQPYVSYVVSASPKWKLEHHLWSFPFVGDVPYKGFAKEALAKKEQEELQQKKLDTYLRGVSAYSTLGWFDDPILSSMIRYKNHHLVNTIIHETVHATLYLKSSADFNERMAVFLGNKGTELFYQKKEGATSETLTQIKNENEDDKVFSEFISIEIKKLTQWYTQHSEESSSEEERKKYFLEIQENFKKNISAKMKTETYKNFPTLELNNARLLLYKTYMQDLSDFQFLFDLTDKNFTEFLKCCEQLKKGTRPEEGLKNIIKRLQSTHLNSNFCAS